MILPKATIRSRKPDPRATTVSLALVMAIGLAATASPARADEGAKEKMKNFFDAGAEAFKAGKYLAAAEAFEKAHALVPSAPLLFSAAQAYRRQYLVDPSPDTLRRALSLYREYLRADPKANRREDAMEALAVLVPIETRAAQQSLPGTTPEPGAAPLQPIGTTPAPLRTRLTQRVS